MHYLLVGEHPSMLIGPAGPPTFSRFAKRSARAACMRSGSRTAAWCTRAIGPVLQNRADAYLPDCRMK
jgi:hypothetical protein